MIFLAAGGVFSLVLCLGLAVAPSRAPQQKHAAFPLNPAVSLPADVLYDRVRPAVVVIVTFDARGRPLGQGSGFYVDSMGTVVTNDHVVHVPGVDSIGILQDDEQVAVTDRIERFDRNHDLAILRSGMTPRAYIPLASATPRVGSRVYAIGNPQGQGWTLSDGLVSAIRPVSGYDYIQTNTAISSGSSGGPLVDSAGRLVGVTTLASGSASAGQALQNLNIAVPAAAVADLLARSANPVRLQDLESR